MSDLDFEVMLAKNYDPKRVETWKEMYTEAKLDGVRVIVLVKSYGTPKYYSRNGRELGMFTHLNPSVRRMCERLSSLSPELSKGLMFDTEAVGMTFGDVSGAIHTKGTVALTCQLHMFHVMPLANFKKGIDSEPQIIRGAWLRRATADRPIKGITVPNLWRVMSHRQVMDMHKEHRKINPATGKPYFEGTMVKNLHTPWTATRSWSWMKIKDSITREVTVTGLKEGTGKYVGMCGALIGDYNGRKVRVSGMTDKQREEFWNKPKSIVGKLVEVESQEETEHGSLRHPRFIRVRDDKEE